MLERKQSAPSAEQKHLAAFVENKESTNNTIPSCSAAMAILTLSKHYLGSPSDPRKLANLQQECIDALSAIHEKEPDKRIEIDFINSKVKEKTNQFDFVELYLPEIKSGGSLGREKSDFVRHVFPLAEVVPLVWKALNDDAKFMHAYPGDEKEKLSQAEKDKKYRVARFFASLNQLRTEKVCHLGNRNELVFILNGIYEGMHLIEDGRSTISSILKESLLRKYQEAKPSDELNKALLNWMESGNAIEISKLVDPKHSIVKSIHTLFIKNGIDPEEKIIKKLINDAISHLDFSCDPKSKFHSAKRIFDLPDFREEKMDRGLKYVKSLITEKMPHFDDEKPRLDQYLFVCDIYSNNSARKILLVCSGLWEDDFDKLIQDARFYLSNAEQKEYSSLQDSFFKVAERFNAVLIKAGKSRLLEKVRDFFAFWFLAKSDRNSAEILQLYSMLLDSEIRSKIILKDEEISEIMSESKLNPKEIDLTVYLINRFFLHAILVSHLEWTEKFYLEFERIFKFVKDKFKGSSALMAEKLLKSSYPSELMDQLEYLLIQRKPDRYPYWIVERRPRDMILMPELCKTPKELLSLPIVNTDVWKNYYSIYYLKWNALIAENFNADYFDLIPTEYRSVFFDSIFSSSSIKTAEDLFKLPVMKFHAGEAYYRAHYLTPSKRIKSGRFSQEYFSFIPPKERMDYLIELFSDSRYASDTDLLIAAILKTDSGKKYCTDFYLNKCGIFPGDCCDLAPIPPEERFAFLAEFLSKTSQISFPWNQLTLLKAIPEQDRMKCIDLFDWKRYSYAVNFAEICRLLPLDVQKSLEGLKKLFSKMGKKSINLRGDYSWGPRDCLNYIREVSSILEFFRLLRSFDVTFLELHALYSDPALKANEDLKKYFLELTKEEQLEALKKIDDKELRPFMADYFPLPDVFGYFPSEEVRFICNKFAGYRWNCATPQLMVDIIKELPSKIRLEFLSQLSCRREIAGIYNLDEFLSLFDFSERESALEKISPYIPRKKEEKVVLGSGLGLSSDVPKLEEKRAHLRKKLDMLEEYKEVKTEEFVGILSYRLKEFCHYLEPRRAKREEFGIEEDVKQMDSFVRVLNARRKLYSIVNDKRFPLESYPLIVSFNIAELLKFFIFQFEYKKNDMRSLDWFVYYWNQWHPDIEKLAVNDLQLIADFVFSLQDKPGYFAMFSDRSYYETRKKLFICFSDLEERAKENSQQALEAREKCLDMMVTDFNLLEQKLEVNWKGLKALYVKKLEEKCAYLKSIKVEEPPKPSYSFFYERPGMPKQPTFVAIYRNMFDFLYACKSFNAYEKTYFYIFTEIARYKVLLERAEKSELKGILQSASDFIEKERKAAVIRMPKGIPVSNGRFSYKQLGLDSCFIEDLDCVLANFREYVDLVSVSEVKASPAPAFRGAS